MILLALLIFLIGFLTGSTKFTDTFKDIKWTDCASLTVTFLGFCFAFITYQQWLQNKKKDDSYHAAKKYLASLDKVRELLESLSLQYNHMCPAPGQIVETQEVITQRIEYLNQLWFQFDLSKSEILNSKEELSFWDVSLKEEFNKKHEEQLKHLRNLRVISIGLNSQLSLYHLEERSDSQNVISEKELFDSSYRSIVEITIERRKSGFDNMFTFS